MNEGVIEFHLKCRPCKVGPVGNSYRALFYGFTSTGQALVELEDGKLRHWKHPEVMLLDSESEFDNWDWEKLEQARVKN